MRVVGRAGPAGTLVCGAEFSGEVGERQTPNLTHRPAAGGARESGGGAFVCARECVYVCRAVVRCASRQCPSTSPPSSSTPSLRPPSFPCHPPASPRPQAEQKPREAGVGGRAGSRETKGSGVQPAMAFRSLGGLGRSLGQGGRQSRRA